MPIWKGRSLTDTPADQFAQITLLVKEKENEEMIKNIYNHHDRDVSQKFLYCSKSGHQKLKCNKNLHFKTCYHLCRD